MEVIASAILLRVPPELSAKISEWAKAHIKEEDLYNQEGKGLAKDHHITLAPQINDESATEHISSVMNNTPALSPELGDIGFFVNPRPDKEYTVLKIAVDPAQLAPVREQVIKGISMYNPSHEFNPHITVAYLKPGACQDLDGDQTFKGMACPIDSCIYSAADGGPKFINLQPAPGPEQVEDGLVKSISSLRNLIIAKLSSRKA